MQIRAVVTGLVLMLSPIAAVSQAVPAAVASEDFVKSHYTKYEYRIAMRDGAKLFTSVYVPQSGAFKDQGPYPFLMTRTPYSCAPYGEDLYPKSVTYSDELAQSGYIFVCQDVRGREQSEGEFLEMRPHIDEKKSPKDVDDASDMYDTVEFLLKHVPNNNGNVGITGISYPGFYTSASIIDSHPAIKAASPQAPMTNLFFGDDGYHGGGFMLAANYGFYTSFKPEKTPADLMQEHPARFHFDTNDIYTYYLSKGNLASLDEALSKKGPQLFHDQMEHNTYDSYWKPRNLADHMKNVKTAVMTVGGWFDAEDLQGPFSTFHAIDKFNPDAGDKNTLVIGPWVHGGWARSDGDHLGDAQFNAKTGEFFRKEIQFPFFEHYLKGKPEPALPKAYVFETGSNAWRKYDAWPPKPAVAKTLYFRANGGLSFEAPSEKESKDEYVSDPAHPVPFVNFTTDSVPQRYMDDDQRFASRRPYLAP